MIGGVPASSRASSARAYTCASRETKKTDPPPGATDARRPSAVPLQ